MVVCVFGCVLVATLLEHRRKAEEGGSPLASLAPRECPSSRVCRDLGGFSGRGARARNHFLRRVQRDASSVLPSPLSPVLGFADLWGLPVATGNDTGLVLACFPASLSDWPSFLVIGIVEPLPPFPSRGSLCRPTPAYCVSLRVLRNQKGDGGGCECVCLCGRNSLGIGAETQAGEASGYIKSALETAGLSLFIFP